MLKMLLMIEKKINQSAEDVADRNAEDVVADRTVKVLRMLLIERSKC